MRVWVVLGSAMGGGRAKIVCVADSLTSAVELLKTQYPAPYKVNWGELRDESKLYQGRRFESWAIEGKFSYVRGKSISHYEYFDIVPYEVLSGTGSGAVWHWRTFNLPIGERVST